MCGTAPASENRVRFRTNKGKDGSLRTAFPLSVSLRRDPDAALGFIKSWSPSRRRAARETLRRERSVLRERVLITYYYFALPGAASEGSSETAPSASSLRRRVKRVQPRS